MFDWSASSLGIEIPKFVDTVTPQYKPKFDALVSSIYIWVEICLCCSLPRSLIHLFIWQLVELKEAEEKSLKESERLEKEIAEVREMKVRKRATFDFQFCRNEFSQPIILISKRSAPWPLMNTSRSIPSWGRSLTMKSEMTTGAIDLEVKVEATKVSEFNFMNLPGLVLLQMFCQ